MRAWCVKMVAWSDHVVAAWSLFVRVRAKMVAWSIFRGLARAAEKREEGEHRRVGNSLYVKYIYRCYL